MLHLPSRLAFYGFIGIVGAWTAMLFGWSTKNIVVSHFDAISYSALSLDIAPRLTREAVSVINADAAGEVNGQNRMPSSISASVLTFGTNGNERFEVLREGQKPSCVEIGDSACPVLKDIEGKQGKAVVINKATAWADAFPGSSWISIKKGAGSNKSGVLNGSIVRFSKRVDLPKGTTNGVLAVMADDNVVIYMNGKKLYSSPQNEKGLSSKALVIGLKDLKAGKSTFVFEVKQNDKADNKPFGLNAKLIFLQPADEKSSVQTIASGTENVRLASSAFLTVSKDLSLQTVSVTLTRKSPVAWTATSDPITKDFRNLRLIDDTTGQVISTISELNVGNACSASGKALVCSFGTKVKPLNYKISGVSFGEVRGYSLYADVLTTNATKEFVAKINYGKDVLVRGDNKWLSDAPEGVGSLLSFNPATTPAVAQCIDGIDNDGDSKIDSADVGCQGGETADQDNDESDDKVVLEARLKARNARRQGAVTAIAEAVLRVYTEKNGNWTCSAGLLPQSSKEISSKIGGYNLASCLVPVILADLPVDPGNVKYFWNNSKEYSTGYNIAYLLNERKLAVYAFNAEGGEKISAEVTLPLFIGTTPTTPIDPVTPPTTIPPVVTPTPPTTTPSTSTVNPALPTYASCAERETWFNANKKKYHLSFSDGKSFDCNEFEGKVSAVMMFYNALSENRLLDAKMPGKKTVGKFVADQATGGIFKGGSGCDETEFAYANSLGEIHLCNFWTKNFTGTDLATDIYKKTFTTLLHEASHIYMRDFSHVQCPSASRYKGSLMCDTRLSKKPFAVGDTRETGAYNFEFWLMAGMKQYFVVPADVLTALDRQLSDFVANRFRTIPSKVVTDYLKEL